MAEYAIAKAKAELGSGASWFLFNLHKWKTVTNDDDLQIPVRDQR
jgi:hypothetical protein